MAKNSRDWTDILIKRGVVGTDQLAEAKRMNGVQLEDALVKLGYADASDIAKAKAEQFGMDFVQLDEIQIPETVIGLVPESLARENVVMPLSQENGMIKVIMHDPNDFETVDKLRFVLNRDIEVVLAPKQAIVEAINHYYGSSSKETESVDSMLQEWTDTALDDIDDGGGGGAGMGKANILEEGDAPIIKLVHLIIQEAVTSRASDIHIEPFTDRVRIRYRIDGVLMERDSPPRRLLASIVSRIKIMGSIDIAEKRRPQDGRIKITVAGKDIDLRVSILPTSHGQSVVMRILDRDNIKVGLRDLGFGDDDWKRFSQLIKRPNGILLVTGPTGSGKTTTLYAALNELNRPDVKIITAEDPVEYYLPGVNPVRGPGQDRHDLRPDHSGHASAEPKHPPRGRNPGRGDRKHGDSGVSDGTPGFQYAAHERCAQCYYTVGRYWRATIPGRIVGHGHHGAATREENLSQVQAKARTSTPCSGGPRPEARDRQEGQFCQGEGLQLLQQDGLSW